MATASGAIGFNCTLYSVVVIWLEVCSWQLLQHRLPEERNTITFKTRVGVLSDLTFRHAVIVAREPCSFRKRTVLSTLQITLRPNHSHTRIWHPADQPQQARPLSSEREMVETRQNYTICKIDKRPVHPLSLAAHAIVMSDLNHTH
jgi:hypothetical protein